MNLAQIEIGECFSIPEKLHVEVEGDRVIVIPIKAMDFHEKRGGGRVILLDPSAFIRFWEGFPVYNIERWLLFEGEEGGGRLTIFTVDDDISFRVRSVKILREFPDRPLGVKSAERSLLDVGLEEFANGQRVFLSGERALLDILQDELRECLRKWSLGFYIEEDEGRAGLLHHHPNRGSWEVGSLRLLTHLKPDLYEALSLRGSAGSLLSVLLDEIDIPDEEQEALVYIMKDGGDMERIPLDGEKRGSTYSHPSTPIYYGPMSPELGDALLRNKHTKEGLKYIPAYYWGEYERRLIPTSRY